MKLRITTTNNLFAFGFYWRNDTTHEWRMSLILGFISVDLYWKRPW